MPTKLKVLVGLMGVSILLALASSFWVSALINTLLLIGVLRGNEGVRWLIQVFAFIGLCYGIFVVAMGIGTVALAGFLGIIVLGTGAFSVAHNAFLIWCLRQQDVQSWMYHKSFGHKLEGV